MSGISRGISTDRWNGVLPNSSPFSVLYSPFDLDLVSLLEAATPKKVSKTQTEKQRTEHALELT